MDCVNIALGAKQLGKLNSSACRAAKGVVGQTDKLVVILGVLAQTTNGDSHAVFKVAVKLSLGAVILLEIVEELLGSGRQVKLLRSALVACPAFEYLLFCGLLSKLT